MRRVWQWPACARPVMASAACLRVVCDVLLRELCALALLAAVRAVSVRRVWQRPACARPVMASAACLHVVRASGRLEQHASDAVDDEHLARAVEQPHDIANQRKAGIVEQLGG